jgi:hypothetical protein
MRAFKMMAIIGITLRYQTIERGDFFGSVICCPSPYKALTKQTQTIFC